MNQFTNQELQNILALITIAPITGKDAMAVALLQQKLQKYIKQNPVVPTVSTDAPKECAKGACAKAPGLEKKTKK